MKRSEINEYIQTGAAIVAIVGIFLLGYEVKQSNSLATQQASSQSWAMWVSYYQGIVESGTAERITKSMTNPEALTLAEKQNLHVHFAGYLMLSAANLDVFSYTDTDIVQTELEAIIDLYSDVFAYPYGKAWMHEYGASFLPAALVAAVLTKIEALPDDTALEYFNRASVRLETIRGEDAQKKPRR